MLTTHDKIKELKAHYSNTDLAKYLNVSVSSIEKLATSISQNMDELISGFFEHHCKQNSQQINISELSNLTSKHQKVCLVSTPDGYQPILQIFNKAPREIYSVKVGDDFKIRCSNDHLLDHIDGWKYAKDIRIGDNILTKRGYQPVTSIHIDGFERVYDFEVAHENHRYWSNGISSHNSGKSFLLCNMLRQAQKEIDAFVYVIDSENALDDDFVTKIGVDISEDNYMYAGVITIAHVKELVSDFINNYRSSGEKRPVMIAIDSLGMLLTDTEFKHLEEGEVKGDQGQRAKQLKALLKGFVQSIKDLNIQMIITDQVYAANQDAILAGINDGLWVVNGAVKYSLSNLLMLTKLRLKGEKSSDVIGINMKAEAIKTRFTKPFQKVAVEVPYETGMDPYSGLIDVLQEMSIITRGGSWYTINSSGDKFQSKNLVDYVPKLLEEAATKTDVVIGSSISDEDEIVEKQSSAIQRRVENFMEFTDKNPDYKPIGSDEDLENNG